MFKLGIKSFLPIGHLLLFIVNRLISFNHVMSSQCFLKYILNPQPITTLRIKAQNERKKNGNQKIKK